MDGRRFTQNFKSLPRYLFCCGSLLLFFITVSAFILPLAKVFVPNKIFTSNFSSIYSAKQILRIILYTFEESVASTLLAIFFGIWAAWFVSQRNFIGRKFLVSLSSVPLCIPPLIIALGYINTFGMSGILNRSLLKIFSLKNPPLNFLYSFWGIVITQGFYNFPLIMNTVADSWSVLDLRQKESAQLLGAGRLRIFFTVTLPQLMPSIISSAMNIFIFCFFSFMIVLLFGTVGGTTLEVAIYHAGRSVLNFKNVSVLASIETSCALLFIIILGLLEKKSLKQQEISLKRNMRKNFSVSERIIFLAFMIFIFIFFLLPLVSISISSFSFKSRGKSFIGTRTWKKILSMKSFYSALGHTVSVGAATSLLCIICGCTWAFFIRLKNRKDVLSRTIPMIPMSVSSVVTGIGLLMLVRKGKPAHLILIQASLFWPFAFRQIFSAASKIPQNIIDSSVILSGRKTDCIFDILVPCCRKNILSAAGFCFAMSAGDSSLPLLLSIQNFDTLSLFTYKLAAAYKFNEACASGLILGLICIIIFSAGKNRD